MIKSRQRVYQDVLPLTIEFRREDADARCVSSGVGERRDKTRSKHVISHAEDRN